MSNERSIRVGTALLSVVCALAVGACGRDEVARARASSSSSSSSSTGGMDAGGVRTVLLHTHTPKALGGGPVDNSVQAQPVAGVTPVQSFRPHPFGTANGTCDSSEASVSDPDCDEAGVRPSPAAPVIPSETSAECPPGANYNEP